MHKYPLVEPQLSAQLQYHFITSNTCWNNTRNRDLQLTASMIRLLRLGGTPFEAIDIPTNKAFFFAFPKRMKRTKEWEKNMWIKMVQIFVFNQIIPMQRKAPFICRFACRSINVGPLMVKTEMHERGRKENTKCKHEAKKEKKTKWKLLNKNRHHCGPK